MGKIVAIGGGELKDGETYKIDQHIVKLSGKNNPKLLFIPTASNDAEEYIELVDHYFTSLGCSVSTLCLISESYTESQIRKAILNSDIIYVGGGGTVRMLETWREYHVDTYLRQAYDKGIVLSGLSAGSICWFVFGHSDSDAFYNTGQWDYVRPYGLGFIHAANCPHYNEEGRDGFDASMGDETISGIALENNTALVEEDGNYYIIKSEETARAYLIYHNNGKLEKKEIHEGERIQI